MDEKHIALRQQQFLRSYLEAHLAQEVPNARANAREKLTKLQKTPFHELSTDVYDESMRRQDLEQGGDNGASNATPPFLQVRQDFHPKRNQARQKLATLPASRFKDLASDVLYELGRRFPAPIDEGQHGSKDIALQRNGQADQATISRPQMGQPAPERPERNLAARRLKQDSSDQSTLPSRPDQGFPNSNSNTNFPNRPIAQGITTNVITPTKGTVDLSQYTDSDSTLPAKHELSGLATNDARHHGSDFDRDLDPTRSITPHEKSRSDQDLELSGFKNRIESLEGEIERLKDELDRQSRDHVEVRSRLTSDLEEERRKHMSLREDHQNARAQMESLQMAHDRLMEDHENVKRKTAEQERISNEASNISYRYRELQKDHQLQKDVSNSLKTQLENIIEEMQRMATRNESLLQEQQQLNATISRLQATNESLKSRATPDRGPMNNGDASQITQDTNFEANVSPSGGMSQVHLNAFKAAIDDLLVTGRSDKPAGVLKPMRKILASSKDLGNDVQTWLQGAHHLDEEERETIEDLRDKLDATMDNLMTAARNHAAGMGMSPTSLLDAAASHVAMTAIDMAKAIGVRGTSPTPTYEKDSNRTKDESMTEPYKSPSTEQYKPLQIPSRNGQAKALPNGLSAPSRPVEFRSPSPVDHPDDLSRYMSRSSINTQASLDSYPPAQETNVDGQDYGASSTEDWEDLKNHIETQTEQVVSSIQAVLTCVRSLGTNGPQNPGLSPSSVSLITEHITHIITIISSVIAVTRQTFTANQKGVGKSRTIETCEEFLAGLEYSCEQMSEIHTKLGHGAGANAGGNGGHDVPAFTKASKQALASASFSIAKTLKQLLNALGGDEEV